MERDALQWLQDNVEHYRFVDVPDSESQLIVSAHSVDSLERFQPQPNRIKQKVSLASVDSFCGYVNRFKNKETTIYMRTSSNGGSWGFEAVMDHHGAGEPQWTSHKALFIPERSVEWMAWTGVHGRTLSQLELAEFIERNLNDVEDPDPNIMLQAALKFEANEKMSLASTMNLDNGATEFHFTKENASSKVVFPHRIKIWIPVFENNGRQTIAARVRYKTNSDGVLTFIIWLVDNHGRIERDTLLAMASEISDSTDGVTIYEGRGHAERR